MKSKIAVAVFATLMWAVVFSFAQTPVSMTTTVTPTTFEGAAAVSIKQYGTGNSGSENGIRFAFDKVGTVAGGAYAAWELKQVKLTFTFDTGVATLTITNQHETQPHTFTNSDTASLEARFSGIYGQWSWGLSSASLLNGSGNTIAAGSDFESSVNAVLNDQLTLQPAGQEGDTYQVAGELDSQRTGSVGSSYFASYSGTGSWNFDVKNSYPVTFNILANDNLQVQGTTPTSSFYTQLEYVMIPEPSAAFLFVLAASGGLWVRRIRNRGKRAVSQA